MSDWFPFFLPLCGLLWSVTGAFMLLVLIVAARGDRASSAGEPSAEELAAATASLRAGFGWSRHLARLSGPFWFFVGLATLWFSDWRAPWILPAVGLFWMLSGAWTTLSASRREYQETDAETVSAALAAASTADGRRRLRRQQLVTGTLLICLGIPTLWFSGIRVGSAPVAVSRSVEDDSRLAEIVRQQIELDFTRHGRVGLVVGAIAGNEEVLLGFGTRRLGDSRPPDQDTLFEIGSISKVFTGILLAQRIESGVLDLNDRVADLLPDGWVLSPAARGVTLQHCTTHSSGLPRLPANLTGFAGAFSSLFGGDPYRDYSESAFREALATTELEFESSTRSLYSNFAVGLLGFVLATQSQTNFESLVVSEICRPLGMHDTAVSGDPKPIGELREQYRATLRLGPVMIALRSDDWRLPDHLAGAGGLRSTGRDMLTFLKANVGRLSSPLNAAIQRSHEELVRADMRIGMNWIHSIERGNLPKVIWHNGGTGGYSTYLGFTDDGRYGVFVLSNSAGSVDTLAVEILEALNQKYAQSSGGR